MLAIPDLPNGYVRRREHEEAIEAALRQKGNLIISNRSDCTTDTASGKSVLLIRCLKTLTSSADCRLKTLWISFGRYHCDLAPLHALLVQIANKLRAIFAEQLGTFNEAHHLHSCSESEVQQYVRMLMSAARYGANREGADKVVLVLDEVTRPVHVSTFAHLGIRVVLTTRFPQVSEYLLADQGATKIEVNGMGFEELHLLAMRTCSTSRGPNDRSLLPLKRVAANQRCCCMLASVMRADEEYNMKLVQDALDGTEGNLVQRCLATLMERMSPVERVQFAKLLLLPHCELIPVELAVRLWRTKGDLTRKQLQSFSARGLLSMEREGRAFSIPTDLLAAAAALTLQPDAIYASDLSIPVRIEAALAIQQYVTDESVLKKADFQQLHASTHVACWEHLLSLHPDSFLGKVCDRPSPLQLCSPLILRLRENGEIEPILNIIGVLLCVSEDCYAQGIGQRSWASVRYWLFDELYAVLEQERGLSAESYLFLAIRLLKHDLEKAAACVDLYLHAFADSVKNSDEKALLHVSDALFLLSKCHREMGDIDAAKSRLASASGAMIDALHGEDIQINLEDVELHPDLVSLKLAEIGLLTLSGGVKESRTLLQNSIAVCQADYVDEYISKELIAAYLFSLGEALIRQGSGSKARKAHEECLAMKYDLYGSNHPATGLSLEALGNCCLSLNQHEKALSMFQKAVDTRCVLYGLDHPALKTVVASSVVCLKQIFGENGDEVIQYLRMVLKELFATEQAANVYTRSIGYAELHDNKDVAAEALWQLTEIYLSLTDDKSAKAFAKKGLDVVAKPHNHPILNYLDFCETKYQHRQLGRAHKYIGDVYKCRTRYIRAAESYQSALLHHLQGGASVEIYAQISSVLQDTLRANNYDTDADIFHFVLTHILPVVEMDDHPEAEDLVVKQDGHSSTWATLRQLLTLLTNQGEVEKASYVRGILREVHEEDSVTDDGATVGVDLAEVAEPSMVGTMGKEAIGSDEMEEEKGEQGAEMLPSHKDLEEEYPGEREQSGQSEPVEISGASKIVGMPQQEVSKVEQDRLNEKLLAAVLAGKSEMAADALAEGANVDTQSPDDGSTPLLIAALMQNSVMTRLLLDNHANPDIADCDGTTPLLATCLTGCVEVFKLLCPDETWGLTALTHRDKDEQTPLLVACRNGRTSIVADLLKKECVDCNAADNLGNTPLLVSVINQHDGVTELLMSTEDLNYSAVNHFGDSALMLATLRGNISMARRLLHRGCSRRGQNFDGLTPADIAVWNNDEGMFELITEEDQLATVIQTAWRRFHVRFTLGKKVDRYIERGLQNRWTKLHLENIVKVQTRIRVFLAKRELRRRLLDSVDSHVRHYAMMKIISLLMIHFPRYVRDFRKRKGVDDRWVGSDVGFPQVTPVKADPSNNNTEIKSLRQGRVRDTNPPQEASPRAQKFANAFGHAASQQHGVVSTPVHGNRAPKSILGLLSQEVPPSLAQVKDSLAEYPLGAMKSSATGELPLQIALRLKMEDDIIRALLSAYRDGASNANHMGNTALHTFCANCIHFKHKVALLEDILSASEEVLEMQNKMGELPLHSLAAVLHQFDDSDRAPIEMICILVKAFPMGARRANGRGDLPLHLALQQYAASDVISTLVEAYPGGVNELSGSQRFPIRIAIQEKCSLFVIRILLNATTDTVMVKEGDGSVLHVALKHKAKLSIVDEVMHHNMYALKQTNDQGLIPLHVALKFYPDINIVRTLLDGYPNASAIRCFGSYPLEIAMDKQLDPEIVKLLRNAHPYEDDIQEKATRFLASASTCSVNPSYSLPIVTESDVNTMSLQKKSKENFQEERERREVVMAQREKDRLERQKAADLQRAERQAELARKREQVTKERAERMEQSRSERKQRALEQIKELEIAVEEKRRQVDETLAEASLQANKEKNNIETLHKNERSEARRRRLEKWMNVISIDKKSAQTNTSDTSTSAAKTESLISETEVKDEEMPMQIWQNWRRSTSSSNSPQRGVSPVRTRPASTKKDATYTPHFRQADQKVEITPQGVTLALSSILHDYEDSDEEQH